MNPTMVSKSLLPLKEVPGSYGFPLLGAQKDSLDFFYLQGEVEFFKRRVTEYRSTVFKVNFTPGGIGFPDPRGIALLDQRSFPVLFDNSKVDKGDVFIGPYRPSKDFTGGYQTLAYIDSTNPKHAKLKNFAFEMLKRNGKKFLPEFQTALKVAFDAAESEISSGKSKVEILPLVNQLAFQFLAMSIVHVDPRTTDLSDQGPAQLLSWIGVMFAPVAPGGSVPIPGILEDLLLRQVPIPFFLVKSAYDKLYAFFKLATEMLDLAEELEITRDEAVHQLIFLVGANAWLGFSKALSSLVYYVGSLGPEFQKKLGDEIRAAVDPLNPAASFPTALDRMPLLKSTALEIFRIAPPVLYQYGRARSDMVVESHNARFEIKKGTLLGGSQALVCRDPVVFAEPDKLIPDRFVNNKELEANVFWSNGRSTNSPTVDNKQCAAKSFVETIATFFLVQLFLRYRTFTTSKDSTPAAPYIESFSRRHSA